MSESATPTRVLVVDDEALYAATLAKVLRRRGFDVEVMHDAEAGRAALRTSPFDVVVLDVKMPGCDGFTALARLRQEHPGVRVILMTGHLSQDDERDAARLGASAYFLKPFQVGDLVACIETLTSRSTDCEDCRDPERTGPLSAP